MKKTRVIYPLSMDKELYQLVGTVSVMEFRTRASVMREAMAIGLEMMQKRHDEQAV